LGREATITSLLSPHQEGKEEYLMGKEKNLMRRTLLLLAAITALVAGSAGVAFAVSQLDQSSDGNRTTIAHIGWADHVIGQTFTAGLSGTLDKVSLKVYYEPPSNLALPDSDLVVEVQSVDSSGQPTGEVLSSTTVSHSFVTEDLNVWTDITLAQPVEVSENTKYALVLKGTVCFRCINPSLDPSSQPGIYYAAVTRDPPYPRGESFQKRPDQPWNLTLDDLMFRTYVSPPPDTTKPTITVVSPTEGASYKLGQSVLADYGCSDDTTSASDLSCLGTVAHGSAIDTASVGPKTFTVTATDQASNTETKTVNYGVVHDFGQGSGGSFAEPVRETEMNQLKAGQAVPVKFGLGGDFGLNIFASGYPTAKRIDCTTGLPTDPVEETVTASTSGLQYDAASGLYTYVWKTQKSWSGTCRELNLKLADGTNHPVKFQLK
jgi:hypothetical protein